MTNKVCKKCNKPLPDGYKYKKCEGCMNQQIEDVKKGLKAVGGIIVTVASFTAFIVTKDKE